jgi:hypothetical protein
MSAYRNAYGRVNNVASARIEWIEVRVSKLTSQYTDILSIAGRLQRQFAADGDTDAARIANDWYLAALAGYRRAMKVGLKAEKHATRKRIERMQAAREDAWHKKMGWVK